MNGVHELKFGAFATLAAVVASTAVACDPYQGFGQGDQSGGVVDPVTFPAANLGVGGSRTQPGLGHFRETQAFADGDILGYFPYLYPSTTIPDPLRIRENGAPYPRVPTGGAYVFDPPANDDTAFPDTYSCSAPPGWTYDPLRDQMAMDEQGAVFASLPLASYEPGVPSTTTYVPVVTEWPVSSSGLPCQKLKHLSAVEGLFGMPQESGRFLAWLVIDPVAGVFKLNENPRKDPGLGLQRWGWFNRYLLAYLDGGYIPTEETEVMEGGATKTIVRMRPQRLYYPRSPVLSSDAGGQMVMAPGKSGAGYDVLTYRRGHPDYSPVCEVWSYDAGGPIDPAELPRSAAVIAETFAATLMPGTPRYLFCLQVREL
jgi:hypothetical protein